MSSSYSLILGETSLLISYMRRNRKFKTPPLEISASSSQPSSALSLLRSIEKLRWSLHATSATEYDSVVSVDPLSLVRPFASVVTSAETSSHITSIGLISLQKFIYTSNVPSTNQNDPSSLFPLSHPSTVEAVRLIAVALYHCRFESLSQEDDEFTLVTLIAVIRDLFASPINRLLSDENVYGLIKTTYRIHRYMRAPEYSSILSENAEQLLCFITNTLCSQLKETSLSTTLGEDIPTDILPKSDLLTAPPYGYPSIIRLFELICTLAELAHENVASVTFPPAKRLIESDAELHSLGLSSIVPPPFLPSSHQFYSSPSALSEAIREWSLRSMLTCNLIMNALQAAGDSVLRYPTIMKLIEDNICKFLLRNCRVQHALLLTASLRIFYHIVLTIRQRIPMQIEVMMNSVYLRILLSKPSTNTSTTSKSSNAAFISDPSSNAYDLKEIVLESLLDFCRLPFFLSELYINYDCSPFATNLFENTFRAFCKSIFPVNGPITSNHLLSMKCILEGLRWIKLRGNPECTETAERIFTEAGINFTDSPPHTGEMRNDADPQLPVVKFVVSDPNDAGATPKSISVFAALMSDIRATRYYKRLLQMCVSEFNKKPKRGISAFQSILCICKSFDELKSELRKDSVLEPAKFQEIQLLANLLRTSPGFDKVLIGQFISEAGFLHKYLRDEYVSLFNFRDQSLDDALRMFLEAFRLPLEAQQIDRVMQSFAEQYHQQNSHLLANADVVHTLAFSLIMLNTDAHNDLIRNKMTLEQFVSNNRGINAGGDVPRPLLESLYKTIKQKEIKMSGEGLTGEVNDALWADLGRVASLTFSNRPYIRLDKLKNVISSTLVDANDRKVSFSQGYYIGLTFYRPPIPLQFPNRTDSNPHVNLQSTPTSGRRYLISNFSSTSTPIPSPRTAIRSIDIPTFYPNSSPEPSTSDSQNADASLTTSGIIFLLNPPSPMCSGFSVDEDMFSEIWNPVLAALSVVFDIVHPTEMDPLLHSGAATDEQFLEGKIESMDSQSATSNPALLTIAPERDEDGNLMHYIREGFTLVSSISSEFRFSHILDRVISILCKFTGLTSDPQLNTKINPNNVTAYSSTSRRATNAIRASALLRFSSNYKNHWALSLVFCIARVNAHGLRKAWRDIIQSILHLLSIGLLPSEIATLDDFLREIPDAANRSMLLNDAFDSLDDKANATSMTSLFNSFSSYFMGESESSATFTSEVTVAEEYCRRYVGECNIGAMLIDSHSLIMESLAFFLQALMDIVPLTSIVHLDRQTQLLPDVSLNMTSGAEPMPPTDAGHRKSSPSVEGLKICISGERDDMAADSIYGKLIDSMSKLYRNGLDNSGNNNKDTPNGLQEMTNSSSIYLKFPGLPTTGVPHNHLIPPLKLRHLLLCIQLLTRISLSNLNRFEELWPVIRSYLFTIISADTSSPVPSSRLPSTAAPVPRSASVSALLTTEPSTSPETCKDESAPENFISLQRPTSSLANLNPSPHLGELNGHSIPAILPSLVIESGVVFYLQLLNHGFDYEIIRNTLLTNLSALLSSDWSHISIGEQLIAGIHKFLVAHSQNIHNQDHWRVILSIVSHAALYRHTYMLGFACLQHLFASHIRAPILTLQDFPTCIDTVTAYITSRYSTPIIGIRCVSMLETMYGHIVTLLPISTAAPANSSKPITPQEHLTQLWRSLCKPLLTALHGIVVNCTVRISLLHSAHQQFAKTHTHNHNPRSVATFSSFLVYVGGFGSVRKDALILLKNILVTDKFATLTIDRAIFLNPSQLHLDSTRSALSILFWQYCVDDLLFPLLATLSVEQAPTLELSADLTIARAHSLALLCKIFLLHLNLLLERDDGRGFRSMWLTVLKFVDRCMVLGTIRERKIMEESQRCVYDQASLTADVDSGVYLTESVEEALKNLLLVMKSNGIFSQPSQFSHSQSATEQSKHPSASPSSSVRSETPTSLQLSSPSGSSPGSKHFLFANDLWELTWAVVDPFFPTMRHQLFPELEPKNIPEGAPQSNEEGSRLNLEDSIPTADSINDVDSKVPPEMDLAPIDSNQDNSSEIVPSSDPVLPNNNLEPQISVSESS